MRTTLSLDDDVAAWIDRLRTERAASLKVVVNEALRLGLDRMEQPPPQSERRQFTRPFDSGRCLLPSLDNITEVLDAVEGPGWK